MTFFRTDHIPGFRTYSQWEQHEASVKPIRGRTYKPIARRRDWYMHMKRGEDGSISLHCNTDEKRATCVTYNPDDTLIISNVYDYDEGFRFIAATTGIELKYIRGHVWLDLPGVEPTRAPTEVVDRVSELVPLHFRRVDNRWQLMTPTETPTYYKLNVKAWNALRKRITPYLKQLEVFCKLRAEDFYERRYHWDSASHRSTVMLVNPQPAVPVTTVVELRRQVDLDALLGREVVRSMETEDLDKWVHMNIAVLKEAPTRYLSRPKDGGRESHPVVLVTSVLNTALEAAKREWRDELFTLAPVSRPTHRLNQNAKYFE